MKIQFQSKPTLKLVGFSPENPTDILTAVSNGAKPSSLKGDFILIAEGNDMETGKPLTVFISTVVAAVPYFLHLTELHCVHSDNVIDCCRMAELTWEWNWNALAQLALFDSVLGDISLHRFITRIPKASIIKVCGHKVEKYHEPFWEELYESPRPYSKLNEASAVLLDILSELPAPVKLSLSLSAGYDSRVLLAGLSHLHRNVVTASMGLSDSTDPRIALQLANLVGFDFKRIELNSDDYLTYANDILKATSGEKLFWHWHTGIYTKKVGFDPQSIHLAGSNGEFARSYYFDKGIFANLIDMSGFTRWDFWLILKNSVKRRVSQEILSELKQKSDFHDKLSSRLQMKDAFIPGMCFGNGLDYFYAAERVRKFIGLGLALYRSEYTTMSPFLDSRFIRYAAKLQRSDKLRNTMHRSIIKQLRPELLNFPTDESGIPMGLKSKPLYFLSHGQMKGYDCTKDAQKLPQVVEWARSGFSELGGDIKILDTNENLNMQVMKWNLPITIGAFVELLKNNGIKRS